MGTTMANKEDITSNFKLKQVGVFLGAEVSGIDLTKTLIFKEISANQ